MLEILQKNWNTIASLFSAFAITLMAIPSIIKVAELKDLFDEPHQRKSHTQNVPTLGGLAIFAGVIFSLSFWTHSQDFYYIKYILSSVIIIFFMGMKDDIVNLVAYKKLLAQIIASVILVYWGDVRVTSFYGLFGIHDVPYLVSILFSILTITLITNSFNLIDGINLLAASVGGFCAMVFGTWFLLSGFNALAVLSFSLFGAILAFSIFNKTPAKIFMGDTGSLLIGFICAVLGIKFIEINKTYDGVYQVYSVPAVAISILIIPIFDTLRVFLLRVLQGKSPLGADRNHLHHQLIDLGFSHHKSVLILLIVNLVFTFGAFYFQEVKGELLLAGILFASVALSWLLASSLRRKKRPIALKKVI